MNVGLARTLYRELTPTRDDGKQLVVGGARALAPMLRKELGVAGAAEDPRGAAVYVHIWAGDGEDEALLKRARRARVPIVALAPPEVDSLPFVLATDLVPLEGGSGFPVERLVRAIAARLGEDAVPLASRLPVLRRAVAQQLVERVARRNGLVAAAVFVPRAGSTGGNGNGGVDLPVLLRNELKLVAQLEQLYGRQIAEGNRLPELAGTAAVGFGLRAVARELLDLVPIARWAVQGAVAYAGTRALGEAALRGLEAAAAPGRH
ncbi:MAG: hypothetical protein ABUS54_01325 [Actinomycetota bacterium]